MPSRKQWPRLARFGVKLRWLTLELMARSSMLIQRFCYGKNNSRSNKIRAVLLRKVKDVGFSTRKSIDFTGKDFTCLCLLLFTETKLSYWQDVRHALRVSRQLIKAITSKSMSCLYQSNLYGFGIRNSRN